MSPVIYSVVQAVVALGVYFVWGFRPANITKEFRAFGLNELTQSVVGTAKISLATLLFAGLWFPIPSLFPAILMGAFMVAAQFYHAKIGNPFSKRLPSFILLALCIFLACR